MTDDIIKLLDELSKRLSPAEQHIFELAVRQQAIDALTSLIISTIVIIVLSVIIILAWKDGNNRYDKNHETNLDVNWTIVFGGGFVLLAVIAITIGFLPQNITKLLNPEYAALKDILSQVTGK